MCEEPSFKEGKISGRREKDSAGELFQHLREALMRMFTICFESICAQKKACPGFVGFISGREAVCPVTKYISRRPRNDTILCKERPRILNVSAMHALVELAFGTHVLKMGSATVIILFLWAFACFSPAFLAPF